jgi:hypothetical protein
MALDAKTFDTLVSYAPEIEQALHIPPRCGLTPARILVLAMMSRSATRTEIRDTARALRQASQYGARIRRVHIHARLSEIVRDLRALGLAQAKRGQDGSFRFTLKAHVRRHMRAYLGRATRTVRSAT